jgi:hypothetical protein
MTASRRARWLVAPVLLLSVVSAACGGSNPSGTGDADDTSTSTSPIGTPVPVLPDGINPIPYRIGDLAALGNLQVRVNTVEPVTDGRLVITASVRNGSLQPVDLTNDVFRVYVTDGSSSTTTVTPGEIASGDEWVGQLAFDVGEGTPALFLVDASPLGERFIPGAFALGELVIGEPDP